jgi:hypothetical protein
MRNSYKILARKPEEKKLLGRHMDWIHLAQHKQGPVAALVNKVMKLWVPLKV